MRELEWVLFGIEIKISEEVWMYYEISVGVEQAENMDINDQNLQYLSPFKPKMSLYWNKRSFSVLVNAILGRKIFFKKNYYYYFLAGLQKQFHKHWTTLPLEVFY